MPVTRVRRSDRTFMVLVEETNLLRGNRKGSLKG